MAADSGLHRGRGTGKGDVNQIQLVAQAEQLAAEMRRRADAGAGIAVLAGMVADELHQLRQGFCRYLRIDHDDVGRGCHQRHGGKILDRIVRHLCIQARVHDEARADHHEGVAVGRNAGDLAGGGVAAGAGDILDKELLAEAVGKVLRDDAGDDVGGASGRETDHHAHGPVGIALREGRGCADQQQHGSENPMQNRHRGAPLDMFFCRHHPRGHPSEQG